MEDTQTNEPEISWDEYQVRERRKQILQMIQHDLAAQEAQQQNQNQQP